MVIDQTFISSLDIKAPLEEILKHGLEGFTFETIEGMNIKSGEHNIYPVYAFGVFSMTFAGKREYLKLALEGIFENSK